MKPGNQSNADAPGHWPTLVACFLHFDLSFMLWVLLGALGIFVAESLHLSAVEKGTLVAIPILSGALFRVPVGMLSDRFGGRRVGLILLGLLFVPLAVGWLGGRDVASLWLIGGMLGVGGASFAVALPLASRWYPRERQGIVMGVAAAGNSGTVITNVLAPRLAQSLGWHNVFGLAMLPLAAVFTAFALLAKERKAPKAVQAVKPWAILQKPDIGWFCFFYSVTFGGYVGLSSFLPLFLRDQYRLPAVTAGLITAVAAFSGSLSRPFGGYIADRVGGLRLLGVVLIGIAAAFGLLSRLPPIGWMVALLVSGMACLGAGNGAVFQAVPQKFRDDIGAATGIIGAVGGLGGFVLPMVMGSMKQWRGSFGAGFVVLAVIAGVAAVTLRVLVAGHPRWKVAPRAPLMQS